MKLKANCHQRIFRIFYGSLIEQVLIPNWLRSPANQKKLYSANRYTHNVKML